MATLALPDALPGRPPPEFVSPPASLATSSAHLTNAELLPSQGVLAISGDSETLSSPSHSAHSLPNTSGIALTAHDPSVPPMHMRETLSTPSTDIVRIFRQACPGVRLTPVTYSTSPPAPRKVFLPHSPTSCFQIHFSQSNTRFLNHVHMNLLLYALFLWTQAVELANLASLPATFG